MNDDSKGILAGVLLGLLLYAGFAIPLKISTDREEQEAILARKQEDAADRAFAQRRQGQWITLREPAHYFSNGADEVWVAAANGTCTLLAGDQIQILSYDTQTKEGHYRVHPRSDASRYYHEVYGAASMRWSGHLEACVSPYEFTSRPTQAVDHMLMVRRMVEGKPAF